MGECYLGSPKQEVTDLTWEGQVDSLRVWISKRVKTLDALTNTLN
jgi:hypothetical protein